MNPAALKFTLLHASRRTAPSSIAASAFFAKKAVREVFFRGEGGEKGIYPSN
jgi:hypothetical protein